MLYWSNVKTHSCSSIAPSFLIFFLSLLSLIVCTLALNIKLTRYRKVMVGFISPSRPRVLYAFTVPKLCKCGSWNNCRTRNKLMANLDNGILNVNNVLQFSNTFPKLSHYIPTITLGNKWYRHYFFIFSLNGRIILRIVSLGDLTKNHKVSKRINQ